MHHNQTSKPYISFLPVVQVLSILEAVGIHRVNEDGELGKLALNEATAKMRCIIGQEVD